ncbi:MAG TPA: hypothetical protein VGK29_20120 [Paludibaculum sp.]|jgi:hypothetical protein
MVEVDAATGRISLKYLKQSPVSTGNHSIGVIMTLKFDDLWDTRNQALTELAIDLHSEASMVASVFTLLDECLDDYEKFFVGKTPLADLSVLVTLKGKNIALGCLSLTLDGLAQEAGALLRMLLEAIELLAYLRDVPGSVDQALNSALPKAGKIAQRINGKFEDLRGYLNTNASHLTLEYDSISHLIDRSSGGLRKVQVHSPSVLRTNLGWLASFTTMLLLESSLTLGKCTVLTNIAPVTTEAFLSKCSACRNDALHLFYPESVITKVGHVEMPRGVEQ